MPAGRQKKPKDHNAPKRALSSYLLFANDNRARIREENPEFKMTDITKLIAKSWKQITEEVKAKYQRQAALLKTKYVEEMAQYKKSPKYAAFQQRMLQWREQHESGPPQHARKSKVNTSKPGKKAAKKAMNPIRIRQKVDSFFKSYHTKAANAPYPKASVSEEYGTAMERSSAWITSELLTKQENFQGALVGFGQMVSAEPDIYSMDFSFGGPGWELSEAMGKINKMVKMPAFKERVTRDEIKELFAKIQGLHCCWNGQCLGDDIKRTLNFIDRKYSLE